MFISAIRVFYLPFYLAHRDRRRTISSWLLPVVVDASKSISSEQLRSPRRHRLPDSRIQQ
jgi:hypothetical protein